MAETEGAAQTSRDKILIAAATMIGEDPSARLSVRAVAARAGVNTGSLRHHFPTQRDLYDTVLAGIMGLVAPDGAIRDTTLDPQSRLIDSLKQMLALTGVGKQARESWRRTHESFIAVEPSEDARVAYLALERAGRRRIESLLDALAEEGALPQGDNSARARFLDTVVNGLSIARALPGDESRTMFETETLTTAVAAMFAADPVQTS